MLALRRIFMPYLRLHYSLFALLKAYSNYPDTDSAKKSTKSGLKIHQKWCKNPPKV
jgi:hypothetical protein